MTMHWAIFVAAYWLGMYGTIFPIAYWSYDSFTVLLNGNFVIIYWQYCFAILHRGYKILLNYRKDICRVFLQQREILHTLCLDWRNFIVQQGNNFVLACACANRYFRDRSSNLIVL